MTEDEELVLVERLAEEFAARFRRGERPSIAEYAERHPKQAELIRETFNALVMIGEPGAVQRRFARLPTRLCGGPAMLHQRLDEQPRGGGGRQAACLRWCNVRRCWLAA